MKIRNITGSKESAIINKARDVLDSGSNVFDEYTPG